MLPEHCDIVPKLRNSHETVELGVRLVQIHKFKIYGPWLLGTGLIFFCIQCFGQHLSVSTRSMLFWWLAPLFEPITLFLLSRLIFKESPSWKEVFGQIPQILYRSGILSYLSFWRLSARRALLQPVFLLEGGRHNKEGGQRRRLIASGNPPFVLTTAIFSHAEALLSVLFVMLVIWASPEAWFNEPLWTFNEDNFHVAVNHRAEELYFYCYALAVMLCRPMYTASGFSCYLSRRVALEAWDIELSFRQIARRVVKSKSLNLCLIFGLFWTLNADDLWAEVTTPKERVQEILEREEFSTTQEVQHTFRFEEFEKPDEPEEPESHSRDFKFDFDPTAIFKWLSVLGLAFILGRLIFLWLNRSRFFKRDPKRNDGDDVGSITVHHVPFGQTPSTTSATDGLQELLKERRFREASAKMFVHAVQILQVRYDVSIPVGATEHEILRIFKPVIGSEDGQQLNTIVRSWMNIAYAHREFHQEQVKTLVASYRQLLSGVEIEV